MPLKVIVHLLPLSCNVSLKRYKVPFFEVDNTRCRHSSECKVHPLLSYTFEMPSPNDQKPPLQLDFDSQTQVIFVRLYLYKSTLKQLLLNAASDIPGGVLCSS